MMDNSIKPKAKRQSYILSELTFRKFRDTPKFLDLTGRSFDRLTVLGYAGYEGNLKKKDKWYCICSCQKQRISKVSKDNLINKRVKSCGCYVNEKLNTYQVTHGLSKTMAYKSFRAAKDRCNNPNLKSYKDYGDRGIKFLFSSFEEFYNELGERPQGMTLDRIDTNGHYQVGNVKWSTYTEQANNTRRNHLITVDGVTQTLARFFGSCRHPFYKNAETRLRNGWCQKCSLDQSVSYCEHKQKKSIHTKIVPKV
jgi:hypothetical protein